MESMSFPTTLVRHPFEHDHLTVYIQLMNAALVFEQAGWIGRDAILMTGINSICYVASTIPP